MSIGERSAGRFEVVLQSQPKKYYKKADKKTVRLLSECFKNLEQDPFYRPGRIKQLKAKQRYRYIVGGLRIIYKIEVVDKTVYVLSIYPRGDVYKKI